MGKNRILIMKINKLVYFLTLLLLLAACNNTGSISSTSKTIASDNSSTSELRLVSYLPPPDNTRNGADVLLTSGDILEIDVFQVNELDKTVQVNSLGEVSLPLIGNVSAAGKTVNAFEKDLEQEYGVRYLQSPEISVFVKESIGQQVTLDGEFSQPGIYAVGASVSLIQVVALAKGLTDLADEEKVYVYREINGRKLVANQNLKNIRSGKEQDPRIFGGDIIVAFTSKQKIANQKLRDALGVAVSVARIATPF